MDKKNVDESLEYLIGLLKGSSGSQSFAMINNVMTETVGMSMHNAVSTQHGAQILNSASTTSTCARILSVPGLKSHRKLPPIPDILINPPDKPADISIPLGNDKS